MSAIASRKILFFIAGTVPTALEQSLIDAVPGTVQVRSVLQPSTYGGGALELCDGVAGLTAVIPAAYSSAYSDVTPAQASDQFVSVKTGDAVNVLSDGGTKANLTTSLTGTNNDMVLTAKETGTGGNAITVEYAAPTAPAQPIAVRVTAKAIKVSLASDSGAKQKETATVAGTITAAVKQVETATAAGTVSGAGSAAIIVTAAGLVGSPLAVPVPVANADTATIVAGKIRAALLALSAITDLFDVGGTTTAITLTRKIFAANDSTLNISIATGTATGITTAASSANTTAGTLGGGGLATVVITSADLTGSPLSVSVPVIESDTAAIVAQKIRNKLSTIDAIVGTRPNRASTAKFILGGSGATVTLQRAVAKANDSSFNISVDNGTCTGLTTAATSANTIAGAVFAISSLASAVKTAIEANQDAAALVSLANAASNDGTGLVTVLAATHLASGAAPSVGSAKAAVVAGSVLVGVA